MPEPIQIVTTTETAEDAKRIVRALVEQRLVACGQIDGPITSIYHWQGNVEESSEYRCTLKSDRRLFSRIQDVVTELHPYDVPELIATPVGDGSKAYLSWLEENLVD
jgi:periplasmic divalent cation tolerance protein